MKERPVMPIFFATDDGYAPMLGVALASLLANVSDTYELRIHVLTTGLSAENTEGLKAVVGERAALLFVDMNEKIAPIADRLVLRDYYSSATYFRLFISEVFPEYSKALYLDCDIVVNGDITHLFEQPLGALLLGGVREDVMTRVDVFGTYVETVLRVPREKYFNAGVLVMNLDAFRRHRILDRFLALLSHRRYAVTQDEDYLNVLCYGKVLLLPYTWNVSPLADDFEGVPMLLHYKLDRKPWHYDGVLFGEYFWQYAEGTPFFQKLADIRRCFDDEAIARDRLAYRRLCTLAEEETAAERRAQSTYLKAARR